MTQIVITDGKVYNNSLDSSNSQSQCMRNIGSLKNSVEIRSVVTPYMYYKTRLTLPHSEIKLSRFGDQCNTIPTIIRQLDTDWLQITNLKTKFKTTTTQLQHLSFFHTNAPFRLAHIEHLTGIIKEMHICNLYFVQIKKKQQFVVININS